jgi:CheY-like chemotaxis protein
MQKDEPTEDGTSGSWDSDKLERLTSFVREHRICWEVLPEVFPVKDDRPLQIGFSLQLYGAHSHRAEPPRRLEGRKVDDQMNSGARRVLIVDDNQDIRRALHDLLESQHYMIKSVGTGVQALEQVRDQRFGVVILDLELPDVNGLEVLRRLKEGDPTLPIIMLTATSNDADKAAALQYGARAFFTKPYSGHALISAVSEAIRRPGGSWAGLGRTPLGKRPP